MQNEPAPEGFGRATAVMAVGTLLSRVTGFGRVFALGYALGATRLTDTYLLANNTPNIIYELVLGGVLSGTFMTAFVRSLRSDDEDEAWHAISAIVTIALVASAALAIAFVFVAPLFIRLYTLRTGGDVASDQLAVATDLLRLFAPQVFFYGVVSVATALLHATRRFAAPMFAPVGNNLVVIAVLLAFPTVAGTRTLDGVRHDSRALLLLGLGTTAGVAVMALAQVPWGVVRHRLRWVWQPRHEAVRTIVRLSGWTVGFVIANQLALFVVLLLANGDAGDVAVYNISLILFQLPHGVIAVSIMTAIAPELADRWASGDRKGFGERLGFGIRTIGAIAVPAAVGLVLLARPVVTVLLEHGQLGPRSAGEIARTLAMMSLGLPAYSVWLFLTRAYQAIQDTRSLFLLYLLENGINAAAALVLYPVLGVRGLALAFALAYTGGAVAGVAVLRRRGVETPGVATALARVALAAAAMGLVVAFARMVGSDAGGGAALRAGVGVIAGVTVYIAAARVLGVGELNALLSVRRRSA